MRWLHGKAREQEQDAGPRVVLKVEGIHCSSCGLLIDDELEEVPGVRSSRTDVRAERTTVQLSDEDAVTPVALVAAVERAGYKATVLA